ncbi:MAG: HAD family hydrolase [Xenococcaceae cyanobacterium MO_188.B29]|nr:HAD family hydrolase [Xenococcaceae cyanobacterium MO_188.B29]
MNHKIYISDLDGTLLRNDASLSSFSKNTLIELIDRGLMFTVATARSVVSIQELLRGVKLNLPVIEFNGAFISDLETGHHEIINHIKPEIVENIYDLILDYDCLPFIASFDGKADRIYYEKILNQGMLWYLNDRVKQKDKRLKQLKDLRISFSEQIVCLTVISRFSKLKQLQAIVDKQYANSIETHLYENRYFPGWYWFTIHDRTCTKANALSILLENYGLQKSETIVFGDHGNDISMFKAANRSIAVGNAIDELKQVATEVINSNQEDSVVQYIYRDWLYEKL